jgi:single-stranded DNA-specific DHH superfamily exonuclease
MFNSLDGRGLLMHHWDTDGICSAAMLLKRLNRNSIVTWTPQIGTFFLTKEQIEWIKQFDYVFIVDMALPIENIQSISNNNKVVIIDHHHQKPIYEVDHYNPVSHGASSEDYPGTTWVLKEILGEKISLYSILGPIGDREKKIKDNKKFWRIILDFAQSQNMTFEDLLKMTYLIDVNYKIGDKKAVEEAPWILLEYQNPTDILENKIWIEKLEVLNKEINRILKEDPEEIQGVLVNKLNTKYSIISMITRRIAWDTGKNTLVVNYGFFQDHDQVYSRSNSFDMHYLINRAHELGINAGGKKDVLGAIVPKKLTEDFIVEILDYLSRSEF